MNLEQVNGSRENMSALEEKVDTLLRYCVADSAQLRRRYQLDLLALLGAHARDELAGRIDRALLDLGVPVESQLFRDMHKLGYIGDWDGPYPLIDISGNLQQAGFDPTSVDTYNNNHGLVVPDCEGGTHNPLYDSRAAALCYLHLMAGK